MALIGNILITHGLESIARLNAGQNGPLIGNKSTADASHGPLFHPVFVLKRALQIILQKHPNNFHHHLWSKKPPNPPAGFTHMNHFWLSGFPLCLTRWTKWLQSPKVSALAAFCASWFPYSLQKKRVVLANGFHRLFHPMDRRTATKWNMRVPVLRRLVLRARGKTFQSCQSVYKLGGFNPSWKIFVQTDHVPSGRAENRNCLKPSSTKKCWFFQKKNGYPNSKNRAWYPSSSSDPGAYSQRSRGIPMFPHQVTFSKKNV